jgi:hypothetical protein
MLTRVTFGATPDSPAPFAAAATVPATWVPCPRSSRSTGSTQPGTSQGPSYSAPVGSVGMSVTKLRESNRSKFGAMSGLLASIPLSRIPTSTRRSPGWCWRTASALTIASPHSRVSSGSRPVGPCGSWAVGRVGAGPLPSGSPTPEVGRARPVVAPTTCPPVAPNTHSDPLIRSTNPVEGASTTSAPIAAFSRTSRPPALSTATTAASRRAGSASNTVNWAVLAVLAVMAAAPASTAGADAPTAATPTAAAASAAATTRPSARGVRPPRVCTRPPPPRKKPR